jgi:hypothetical protein
MYILKRVERKNTRQDNEEINEDGMRQLEKKNKISAQERACTSNQQLIL